MKKILFILMIFGVVSGVFAQFSWQLNADFISRLASFSTPTGEKTKRLITVGNSILPNNTGNNPTTRGDFAYTSGTIDLFNVNRTNAT